MEMIGLIPMLDAGHGYMIAGQYQTKGKRSPAWECGVIHEGVSNKHFVWDIMKGLIKRDVPFYEINPEARDIPLRTRVNRANKIHRADPSTYLFSVHSNAGGGTGIEGFTSVGETKSDSIAEVFLEIIEDNFADLKMRFDNFDGDKDKEVDYYILRNTICPAFLLEILFMDFRRDYLLLWDDDFRASMVEVICDIMAILYHGKDRD